MKQINLPKLLCSATLCLYFTAVFFARQSAESIFIYYEKVFALLWLTVALFLAYVFCRSSRALSRAFSAEAAASRRECVIWFTATVLLAFSVLAVYYIIFFPGAYSPDSLSQLKQATTGVYSDWHPFMHTLLFFTIPLKLFGGSDEYIVLLQLVWFSLALGYLNYSLMKNGCSRLICAAELLFVLLSPVTGRIMMYPWKDCGFAIFATVLVAQYVSIVCTRGTWLEKSANLAVFVVSAALTTLMRHNAILFVLPLLAVAMLLCWKRKRLIAGGLIGGYVALFLLIKGPVYSLYDVEKPDNRVIETTGACMVIMGEVVTENPNALPDYIRAFLYEVAPKEVWEEKYSCGNFNYVKWDEDTDVSVIEKAGYGTMLMYTYETVKADKLHALHGFLALTDMVWKIDGSIPAEISPSVEEVTDNARFENLRGNCWNIVTIWTKLVKSSPAVYIFYYVGLLNLLLISFSLSGITRWGALLRGVHALPILIYNFGTALLLTGPDWRFFFYTFPVFIPFAFLILRKDRKDMAL